MGFARRRLGQDGKPRYTAYYLDIRGQERSAGTFPTKKQANDAWKKSEAGVRAGKQGDPGRSRQTFETYVLQKWLPHHMPEPEVRAEYARQIRKHLLPLFSPMKMRDIMPEHVRQWVTWMQTRKAGARTIQYCKTSILNAILLPRWTMRSSPSTPAAASRPRLFQESGLRWGELPEPRVHDLDPVTRILTVSRGRLPGGRARC